MFPEQSEEDDDSDDEGKQDEMTIAQGRVNERKIAIKTYR